MTWKSLAAPLGALALAACTSGDTGSDTAARPADAAAHAAPAERSWTFDGGPQGGLPPGFEAASGTWALRDEQAPQARGVIVQEAANPSAVFNVLLADGAGRDVDLSVALRAREGEIDQGGGLVWRAQDGANYYIARWNPLEENFRVYKVVGGKRQQLASTDVALDPAAWHTLAVRMRGERIECELDGRLLLEARDATFAGAGRVGLWTKADARTAFDDLALQAWP